VTAEAIARVVRDVRQGMFLNDNGSGTPAMEEGVPVMVKAAQTATIVDSTAIYHSVTKRSISLYEDHRVLPPWQNSMICYQNEHGNVYSMLVCDDGGRKVNQWQPQKSTDPELPDPEHSIEWDRVRGVLNVFLFGGGRSRHGTVPVETTLVHVWQIPYYPDGEIADISWMQLHSAVKPGAVQNQLAVMLQTLTMCNCVNVQVCEPDRPRAERRRLERTGVTVTEIHITPNSKSYRGKGQRLVVSDNPLSPVRGHRALYGPKYGRGLLFGKYEGEFWIPPHVRGNAEFGEVEHSYVAEP